MCHILARSSWLEKHWLIRVNPLWSNKSIKYHYFNPLKRSNTNIWEPSLIAMYMTKDMRKTLGITLVYMYFKVTIVWSMQLEVTNRLLIEHLSLNFIIIKNILLAETYHYCYERTHTSTIIYTTIFVNQSFYIYLVCCKSWVMGNDKWASHCVRALASML